MKAQAQTAKRRRREIIRSRQEGRDEETQKAQVSEEHGGNKQKRGEVRNKREREKWENAEPNGKRKDNGGEK